MGGCHRRTAMPGLGGHRMLGLGGARPCVPPRTSGPDHRLSESFESSGHGRCPATTSTTPNMSVRASAAKTIAATDTVGAATIV